MRFRFFAYPLALLCFSLFPAAPVFANEAPAVLARLAVSEKASESGPAIAELRAMGPEGLKVLFETYSDQIKRAASGQTVNEAEWQRVSAALDSVSRQRNSYASGL